MLSHNSLLLENTLFSRKEPWNPIGFLSWWLLVIYFSIYDSNMSFDFCKEVCFRLGTAHSSDSLNFLVIAWNQNSKQKLNKAQLARLTAFLLCSIRFKVCFVLLAISICSLLKCGFKKFILFYLKREFCEKEANVACNHHWVQSFF